MKLDNKGFSLVEVLLAVLVSTIVLGAITAMIMFGAKSSKETNQRIELQNSVKDALNHIESHCMEAETASWQQIGTANVLVVYQRKDDVKAITSPDPTGEIQVDQIENLESDAYAYWFFDDGDPSNGKSLYFGKCSKDGEVQLTNLKPDTTDENIKDNRVYLLADNITDFNCVVFPNLLSGKSTVEIYMEAKNDNIEYSTNKTVYMRNQ